MREGGSLAQAHGQAYLILYSALAIAGSTAVWWHLRLLSRSFGGAGAGQLPGGGGVVVVGGASRHEAAPAPSVPPEILPLMAGAWLVSWPGWIRALGWGLGGAVNSQRQQAGLPPGV